MYITKGRLQHNTHANPRETTRGTRVLEQEHKAPRKKRNYKEDSGEPYAHRQLPPLPDAAKANAGEEGWNPSRPKPTEHHRTIRALWTSGTPHRERQGSHHCGVSAGAKPRTRRSHHTISCFPLFLLDVYDSCHAPPARILS